MRRLVFVTQHVDPGHPLLAATVPKLRALAARVDELVVLADGVQEAALPANCRVKSFRAGTRLGRGVRFLLALLPELRGASAVVAHMVPLYALLAAPFARPLRVPVLLWYTQWHASGTLRLAERAATRVLSVDESSFPFPSRKLVAIGHGVDPEEIAPRDAAPGSGVRLLALGRYSPVKGYETVVRAVAAARAAGVEATVAVHGPVANAAEERHRAELQRLVRALGVETAVTLGASLPRAQALADLARVDALVSATVRGAADKVVLESALAAVPAIVPAWAFRGLVPDELRFDGSAESLAERLAAFSRLDAGDRERLGRELRDRAVAGHSVAAWADAVLAAARPAK